MTSLQFTGVGVRYGQHDALSNFTDTVKPGEWLCLIGPNGAGKSSLLRSVAGLAKHSGEMVNEFSSFKVQVPIKPVTIGDIAYSDDSEFL